MLVSKTIVEEATELFKLHCSYPGDALINHNRRIYAFSRQLAAVSDEDASVLEAACMLHDIGLLVTTRTPKSYLERNWEFAKTHAEKWKLSDKQRQIVKDSLLYNHSLRALSGIHPVADAVRRAVQTEHSMGLISNGIPKDEIKEAFSKWPRLNLTSILVDFARITFFEDGPMQLKAIFFPKRR